MTSANKLWNHFERRCNPCEQEVHGQELLHGENQTSKCREGILRIATCKYGLQPECCSSEHICEVSKSKERIQVRLRCLCHREVGEFCAQASKQSQDHDNHHAARPFAHHARCKRNEEESASHFHCSIDRSTQWAIQVVHVLWAEPQERAACATSKEEQGRGLAAEGRRLEFHLPGCCRAQKHEPQDSLHCQQGVGCHEQLPLSADAAPDRFVLSGGMRLAIVVFTNDDGNADQSRNQQQTQQFGRELLSKACRSWHKWFQCPSSATLAVQAPNCNRDYEQRQHNNGAITQGTNDVDISSCKGSH
mmetsp:Transcript_54200/g.129124  ORF Transcript_54200/g.129124 Transcript_54200/m.129124 type:complete len:305 (+) Transcript_54200:259-1173(+)